MDGWFDVGFCVMWWLDGVLLVVMVSMGGCGGCNGVCGMLMVVEMVVKMFVMMSWWV